MVARWRGAELVSGAMSEENVEIMRKGFEALRRGGVDALVDFIHPEFEAESPPELSVEPQTYRGPEGIRAWFAGFDDAVEDVRLEPEEFIDAGERVVVPVRLAVKGRESGIEAEQRLVQVWTLRDGRAIRIEAYADKSSALAAVGLSEEAPG
jgi:uncharacterized protein